MAKEVKILEFNMINHGTDRSIARRLKGKFLNYYDFPEIEAEINRYLAAGFSIVSCNRLGSTNVITFTLQR